jgi:hypothetical protein
LDTSEASSTADFLKLAARLQECMRSKDEGVAATALEALGRLCEGGAVGFQAAWRLAQGCMPTLPSQPSCAAAWVSLLSHAHGEAAQHPEQVAGFVEVLWGAVEHPSAQVSSIFMHPSSFLHDVSALIFVTIRGCAAQRRMAETLAGPQVRQLLEALLMQVRDAGCAA